MVAQSDLDGDGRFGIFCFLVFFRVFCVFRGGKGLFVSIRSNPLSPIGAILKYVIVPAGKCFSGEIK